MATHLPQPPFGRRQGLVSDGQAVILGQSQDLSTPVNWVSPGAARDHHLYVFTLHYMEYLEDCDDERFSSLVTDWMEQNPAFGDHFWRAGWHPFVISIRSVVWMQELVRREGQLDKELVDRMCHSLHCQLDFLSSNLEFDLRGNHLAKNLKALLWGAAFFGGQVSQDWKAKATRSLDIELDVQVLQDGLHFERSPAYHLQVMADFLESYSVLEPDSRIAIKLKSRLASMGEALVLVTHSDGAVSLFNDGWLDTPYTPAECLRVLESLTGHRVSGQHGSFALEDAGYFGWRDDQQSLIMDAGLMAPDELPAHGHGDMLSFEWCVGDQRAIVDTGVFQYESGPERAYSRGTPAHNTMTLDGEDQAEFWAGFRVGRRGYPRDVEFDGSGQGCRLSASHDGYHRLKGGPVHHREFRFDGLSLEVLDRVSRGAGQLAESNLLVHPDCEVERTPEGVKISSKDWLMEVQSGSKIAIVDAKYFPSFGKSIPTRQIKISYGKAPCQGQYSIRLHYVETPAP